MANYLQVIRKNRGITLDELAKGTGIKRGTLSNYELGKTEPKLRTFAKIADFYGMKTITLLEVYLDE